MKRRILKVLLVASLVMSPVLLNKLCAQVPDPGNGGNGPPVGAPIDGGSLLLLIAGAAAGSKKIHGAMRAKKLKMPARLSGKK